MGQASGEALNLAPWSGHGSRLSETAAAAAAQQLVVLVVVVAALDAASQTAQPDSDRLRRRVASVTVPWRAECAATEWYLRAIVVVFY